MFLNSVPLSDFDAVSLYLSAMSRLYIQLKEHGEQKNTIIHGFFALFYLFCLFFDIYIYISREREIKGHRCRNWKIGG